MQPSQPSPGEVTRLLRAWGGGDASARDRLIPLIYEELRRQAAAQLRRERREHTLRPTDLVHETYLRLRAQNAAWENRHQLFVVAAQLMRRILVDHARRRAAGKRFGGLRVTLGEEAEQQAAAAADLLEGRAAEEAQLHELRLSLVEHGQFLESDGLAHTCGAKADGTVACWGHNGSGQAAPPGGTFTSVSAGRQHTCGVKADGTVACWGYNGNGQAAPPAGVFAAVSAGGFHACGLKTDGAVACWGYNAEGQASPPGGTFSTISAGNEHTCGVKSDGTVACWGFDLGGNTTPPSGSFIGVSAGLAHTCALRTGGTVVCWGSNFTGQATPPVSLPFSLY